MKRLIVIFAIATLLHCFTVSLLLGRTTLAASATTNSLENFQKAVKVGNNAQEFVGVNTLANIMNGITSFIVGDTSCTAEMKQQKKCDTGALGAVGGMIAFMYEAPPISSKEYIADLGSNLGLMPKSAYAAGEGWKVLAPVMDLWKLMRNLTYLMFTVIFVVIGFMIMFRAKMGPAAVTIQMAIPKIVMSLILVTFSYAIAGLIVDVAFLGNAIIVESIFRKGPMNLVLPTATVFNCKVTNDPIGCILPVSPGYMQTTDPIMLIRVFWDAAWSGLTLNLANIGISFIFSMIILNTSLKIFLGLLGKYVTVVLSIVFAPIILLMGTVSGGSDSFMGWVKSYLSAVLVFPVTFLIMNIAIYLAYLTAPLQNLPPFDFSITGAGGAITGAGKLLALGVFLLLPSIPQIIDNALQVKPSPLGAATGAEAGGVLKKIPVIGSFMG